MALLKEHFGLIAEKLPNGLSPKKIEIKESRSSEVSNKIE